MNVYTKSNSQSEDTVCLKSVDTSLSEGMLELRAPPKSSVIQQLRRTGLCAQAESCSNMNVRNALLSFILSSCSWPKLSWRSENKSPTRSDISQLPNSTASVTARRWVADIRVLRDAQYLSAIANGGRSRYADMMAATCLAISLGDSSGASRSALLNSTITSGSGGGGGGGNGLASTAREGGKVYLQSVITECCHVLIVQIFIRVTISYIRIFMGLFCGIEQHRKK